LNNVPFLQTGSFVPFDLQTVGTWATNGFVPDATTAIGPVQFFLRPNGTYFTNITKASDILPADMSSYTLTYYVDPVDGLDTNTGLSIAQAFKTLSKALTTVGANRIILYKPGCAFLGGSTGGNPTCAASFIIAPWDGYDSGSRCTIENRLTTAGAYTETSPGSGIWTAITASAAGYCVNANYTATLADGAVVPIPYVPSNTSAGCDANVHSCFISGTSVRVNVGPGNNANNVRWHVNGSNLRIDTAVNGVFIGCDFVGGSQGTGSSTATNTLKYYDCGSYYGYPGVINYSTGAATTSASDGGAVWSSAGETWWINSRCYMGPTDGLDYKTSRNFLEVNSNSIYHGIDAIHGGGNSVFGSCNASTGHGSKGIRVGGMYGQAGGRVVHDIKQTNTGYIIVLGSRIFGSTGLTTDNVDLAIGGISSDGSQMWAYDVQLTSPDGNASTSLYRYGAQDANLYANVPCATSQLVLLGTGTVTFVPRGGS
jgi:hypothetical protein